MIFPRNSCFHCALSGNVAVLFYFYQKYIVQKPLLKRQVCSEFMNVMIDNNLSHKSGAKSTLYDVAMKVFPLSSHIFICTCSFFFAVM